ncbi:MAG: hypothetical protein ACK51L_04965 [bacterium]
MQHLQYQSQHLHWSNVPAPDSDDQEGKRSSNNNWLQHKYETIT